MRRPPLSALARREDWAAFRQAWSPGVTMREEEPHTTVVVPSLTLDQSELRKIAGVSFYEERLLFLLIRLRNPRARMVYVTSQPVHPIILEYYLQFLAGIPASHGSRPEYDVSRSPLNISVGPPPVPGRVARTLARPSSTCCHCTASPSSSH